MPDRRPHVLALKARPVTLVLSCEHGGNRVPAEWRHLFRGKSWLLETHRGWDPGARDVARFLSIELGAPVVVGRVTRLLVDLNRSPGSPTLWSKWTDDLTSRQRARILRDYHTPYRDAIRSLVTGELGRGANVVHVSVHSFTPVMRGRTRKAHVGLLFDPAHDAERSMCTRLRAHIRRADPGLVVRSNYPYKGVDDAVTTWLRTDLDPRRYAGIEIEMNQRLCRRPPGLLRLSRALATALAAVVRPER
jgi:predicted N-formylglutamate amidohydrolase